MPPFFFPDFLFLLLSVGRSNATEGLASVEAQQQVPLVMPSLLVNRYHSRQCVVCLS